MSERPDALVVYVTAPEDEAPALARALVQRRLAACVNLIAPVRSVYRWNDEVRDDVEVLLVIKTTREGFEPLRAAVEALHSYDVPEVIALPVEAAHRPYQEWIHDSVGSQPT